MDAVALGIYRPPQPSAGEFRDEEHLIRVLTAKRTNVSGRPSPPAVETRSMRTLTTNQVDWLREDPSTIVIFVRDQDAFETAHIPGSKNVPLRRGDFVANVRSLVNKPGVSVVVYATGPRGQASLRAARALARAGFTEVFCYKGGIKAWIHAGKDVERGHS